MTPQEIDSLIKMLIDKIEDNLFKVTSDIDEYKVIMCSLATELNNKYSIPTSSLSDKAYFNKD